MSSRQRIAIVYWDEIGGPVSTISGFGPRYRTIVDHLRSRYEVKLFRLALKEDAEDEALYPGDATIRVSSFPGTRAVRAVRLAQALFFPTVPVFPWQKSLAESVDAFQPDLTLGFAWKFRSLFALPVRTRTTALFVEEDIPRDPDTWPRSLHARLLRSAEEWSTRRALRPARAFAVIGPTELDWARREFRSDRIVVVPHTIDIDFWAEPVQPTPAADPFVFVAGQLGHWRNADGLGAVVRALRDMGSPIAIRVASVSGLRPSLDDVADDLIQLGQVDDLRPHYRSATAVLVPSFQVSGVKTTILQAWAAGCAVVTTTAAARTVGGGDGTHLASGDTPEAVASALILTCNDPSLRATLAENGRQHVHDQFGPQGVADAIERLLALAE